MCFLSLIKNKGTTIHQYTIHIIYWWGFFIFIRFYWLLVLVKRVKVYLFLPHFSWLFSDYILLPVDFSCVFFVRFFLIVFVPQKIFYDNVMVSRIFVSYSFSHFFIPIFLLDKYFIKHSLNYFSNWLMMVMLWDEFICSFSQLYVFIFDLKFICFFFSTLWIYMWM